MKQLTCFFGGCGGGVTINFRITHHYFLCFCCPTLWMPTFLAQLQEDLACQRKVYSPHAHANQDDQVWGSQDIWSGKWCVSEMKICEKKRKVIIKHGSTFDLEGAHHLKNIRKKKQKNNTSRESQMSQGRFCDPRCQLKPDTSSRWSGASAPLPMNRRHHLHHPSRFGTEIHAGKLITVVICIIDLSIATPEF